MSDNAVPEGEDAKTQEQSVLAAPGWGLSAALSFAVSTTMLTAYHFFAPPPEPKLARVDIAQIIEDQQRSFADLVAKGSGQQALDYAARAGMGLSQAVKQLAQECGCVILVSDAVVAGAEDLTPRMRELIRAKGD